MPVSKTNKSPLRQLITFLMWLVGIIVALSIGYSMIDGVLSLPSWLGGATLAMIAGWIVVITTLLGVILEIVEQIR